LPERVMIFTANKEAFSLLYCLQKKCSVNFMTNGKAVPFPQLKTCPVTKIAGVGVIGLLNYIS